MEKTQTILGEIPSSLDVRPIS
jgi:hypothetical protein